MKQEQVENKNSFHYQMIDIVRNLVELNNSSRTQATFVMGTDAINRLHQKELAKVEQSAIEAERERIDWEMLLSEIEIDVANTYETKSLDSSDQRKWGDAYKDINTMKTDVHNNAVRLSVQAFRSKLLKALAEKQL